MHNLKIKSLDRKLIWYACARALKSGADLMSFGSMKVFSGVQEALVLALMLVFILVLFYVNIDFSYKIFIGVIVFATIFLAILAATLLAQQREIRRAQN
jgi:hypothetical protein